VGDPDATVAYLPLLDLPRFSELAGPDRLAAVLLEARAAASEGCVLLLEYPGPSRDSGDLAAPPDPLIERLSLGHRKTAARGVRGPTLDRILQDPDPRVVEELLRNPRLRESEVLAIAARRPSLERVFWSLARCERWIQRPAVRRAVALNPYAPPRLAAAVVVTLGERDLLDIAGEAGLHPAVRDAALLVTEWRRRETGR
jgi:hypothetical protein